MKIGKLVRYLEADLVTYWESVLLVDWLSDGLHDESLHHQKLRRNDEQAEAKSAGQAAWRVLLALTWDGWLLTTTCHDCSSQPGWSCVFADADVPGRVAAPHFAVSQVVAWLHESAAAVGQSMGRGVAAPYPPPTLLLQVSTH